MITIFRSTGPVISTRRSAISSGIRRDAPVGRADVGGLGQEVRQLAAGEPLEPLRAPGEQLAAPLAELPLEVGQERDRVGRQDVVGAHAAISLRCSRAVSRARGRARSAGCQNVP